MRELDAVVDAYSHLDKLPRANEALRELQKIASLVKPIMRGRGWRVGTLTEFWPDQKNLLGLNVNRGQKICLRLRYPGDKTQFMPLEQVCDTMLHELCHNVIGPHDASFQALWNELRDEYTDLKIKGYTGEGFLSEGRMLGGRNIPPHELRRQARLAAERRSIQKVSGQRLGGRAVSRGVDIRSVIADAASRRTTITRGCGSGTQDGEDAGNYATRNGFRTQAEEDQANERAIAEALWELAQQDQQTNGHWEGEQWKSDGLAWSPETGLDVPQSPDMVQHKREQSAPPASPTAWFQDDRTRFKSPLPRTRPYSKIGKLRPDSEVLNPADLPRNISSPQPSFTSPSSPPPSFTNPPSADNSSSSVPSTDASSTKTTLAPKVFYLPEKPVREPPPMSTHPALRKRNSTTSSNGTDSSHQTHPSVSSLSSGARTYASPISEQTSRFTINTNVAPFSRRDSSWTCPTCTLSNPATYLVCAACERQNPCQGTIDDFTTVMDLGPDGTPLQSPVSPAELPGSFGAWPAPASRTHSAPRLNTTASIRASSLYSDSAANSPGTPVSLSNFPMVPASLRTARSLAAATEGARNPAEKKLGWNCRCGAFMEEKWWTCSACGRMKETS